MITKSDKNNSFKVPDGYFSTLSGNIMDKMAQEEISWGPKEGFKVPDGYFETVNTKVLQQLKDIKTPIAPSQSYKKYYYIAASIAAMVLLLIGFQWDHVRSLSYSDLAHSDIEQYFEFTELGVSSYDLAEILPLNELDLNDILENKLDNDNIIDYLNSNIEDFEELNLNNDE